MAKKIKARDLEYIEKNKAFVSAYAQQEGVTRLKSGTLYRVIEAGEGVIPNNNSLVLVKYRGRLIDGRTFDSNLESAIPAAFRLNELIIGWQDAMRHMPVGSKWELVIPYEVGYGDETVDNIRKYSTLIFEVELVSIS